MKRQNFTLKQETIDLLDQLAKRYFEGNKSRTVRVALETLAHGLEKEGWVISGYSPVEIDSETDCHICGNMFEEGRVLYRPVFEKGKGPEAIPRIPEELWLDCPTCISG